MLAIDIYIARYMCDKDKTQNQNELENSLDSQVV